MVLLWVWVCAANGRKSDWLTVTFACSEARRHTTPMKSQHTAQHQWRNVWLSSDVFFHCLPLYIWSIFTYWQIYDTSFWTATDVAHNFFHQIHDIWQYTIWYQVWIEVNKHSILVCNQSVNQSYYEVNIITFILLYFHLLYIQLYTTTRR